MRNAVFCPVCGESSCSWACYLRHLAQHAKLSGRPATYPGEARRNDRQDVRASREQPAAGGAEQALDPNANDLVNCNPPE
ncbi:MAG: hypothetical protein ACLQGP_24040 [Isosphaeraceae bacterium]